MNENRLADVLSLPRGNKIMGGRRFVLRSSLLRDAVAIVSLCLFVALGHWQQFLHGARPVGGDKSSFMFGLMCDYADARAEGELPFWNERWGLGFAGVAESQVGAFYPPHLFFYQLLPADDAFRWNYLFHRLLIVLVTYCSCRGLGLRALGSWVATLVHVAGGFAIVHLDHLWSVESTVWFPLAVCLTHRWLLHGSPVALLALPWCLALQLTVGHYQLAFYTLVTTTLLAVLGFVWRGRLVSAGDSPLPIGRWLAWFLAVVIGYGLASIQLLPTAYLAAYLRGMNPYNLSEDYLEMFAQPPWMEVNLFLPYLYVREPLWRSVAWTPLRTSPEECLQFVGLVPLALALGTVVRWRRLPFVQIWSVILLLSMLFSFGHFVPGGDFLKLVPGFSFFRCAARWTMVTHWSLGLLAGFGADHVHAPVRMFRWWRSLMVLFGFVLFLVGGWWYSCDRAARHGVEPPSWLIRFTDMGNPFIPGSAMHAIIAEMPIKHGPEPYTWKAWERLGRPDVTMSLMDHWPDVAKLEILPSATIVILGFVTLAMAARLRGRRRGRWVLTAVIVLLCLADFGMFRWLFPESNASPEQLVSKGTVVDRLESLPKGSRILGPGGNFLTAFGLSPVLGYRTLDLPMPEPARRLLTQLHREFPRGDSPLRSPPHSLLGLAAILVHPAVTAGNVPGFAPEADLDVDLDECLDWSLDGSTWTRRRLRARGLRVQSALRILDPAAPALVVASNAFQRASIHLPFAPISEKLEGLYRDQPLPIAGTANLVAKTRHSRSWKVTADGSSVLVLGELYLPGWRATIARVDPRKPVGSSPGDSHEPPRGIDLVLVDEYWQGVELTGKGDYHVELRYVPPGFRFGVAVSTASLVAWVLLASWCWRVGKRRS